MGTTISKDLVALPFDEFKAYIEKYTHITESAESLYVAAGGILPKKNKVKSEGE
jgi:hypothetical protein